MVQDDTGAVCAVCQKQDDLKRCGACKVVFYCCVEHQRADRKAHKHFCKYVDGGGDPAAYEPPADPVAAMHTTSWAIGLSPDKQREWLLDCYRMRVDDEYAWGGGNLRGLYNAGAFGDGANPTDIIHDDFLVFCRLAQSSGAIPAGWDWDAFLMHAAENLRYAFEKSDAQEKYGSENVFAAAMGGRSLRATAEAIFGTSCMAHSGGDPEAENAMLERVEEWRDAREEWLEEQEEVRPRRRRRRGKGRKGRRPQGPPRDEALFAAVGGVDLWETFAQRLEQHRPRHA